MRESALADDLEERRAYSVYVEGYLRTRDAQDRVLAALRSPQYSADEVLGVAASMWLYRHSRFHQLAKTLLFEPPHLVTGYTPKTESTVLELSNSTTKKRASHGLRRPWTHSRSLPPQVFSKSWAQSKTQ